MWIPLKVYYKLTQECFLTKKFFSSVFPLFKSISSHKWNFKKKSSRGSILHTLHRYQWGCHLLVRFGAGGLSGLLFTWSPILLFRISHFVKCTATIILKKLHYDLPIRRTTSPSFTTWKSNRPFPVSAYEYSQLVRISNLFKTW